MKVVDYDRIQWYLGAREDGAPTVYTYAREVDDAVFEIDDKTHDLLPKVGSWKKVPSIIGVKYQCSMCYRIYRMPKNVYNFCPHCGATMSYESEGEQMTNEEYWNALHAAVDKLRPYYDIDKVKHNSVYVWAKGDGDNVFDIHKDNVIFYDANHVIPDDVIPIIREIQACLM